MANAKSCRQLSFEIWHLSFAMIIVMKTRATTAQVSAVVTRVESMGYRVHLSQGEETTIIGVIGDDRPIYRTQFELLDGVEKTVPILKPFKLASRDLHPPPTPPPLPTPPGARGPRA